VFAVACSGKVVRFDVVCLCVFVWKSVVWRGCDVGGGSV